MKELITKLSTSKLFNNIDETYIKDFLNQTSKNVKKHPKNTILFQQGDRIDKLMFVSSGKLQIVKYTYTGQKSIIANLNKGDFFAEAIALTKDKLSPVTVESIEDSEVIEISVGEILNNDINSKWSRQLLLNLLEISFDKSFALNKKIDVLSQRTIKDKFLTYLDLECKLNKTDTITLPFATKQALANYLEVDRTALFRVMKQLQDEGVIIINNKDITLNQSLV